MEFGLNAHGWQLRGALMSAQNTPRPQILTTKEIYFPRGTSDWEKGLGGGEVLPLDWKKTAGVSEQECFFKRGQGKSVLG